MSTVSPLAAAAHELKTPLTLISGLSSVILENDLSDDLKKEYLERIRFSSDRMLKVVQSLISSYKVEQNEFQLELEPVNIRQVTEDIAHETMPYCTKLQKNIQISLSPRSKTVVAHRVLLSEVIFNIIDNALKHAEGKNILISSIVKKQRTDLIVKSEGSGFSRSEFNKLQSKLGGEAQPFLEHSNSSGLGIYIAKQLTTAMRGDIQMQRHRNALSMHLSFLTSSQLQLL